MKFHISPTTRPSTRDAFGESFGTRLATPLGKPLSESEMHSMLQLEEMRRNLSSGWFFIAQSCIFLIAYFILTKCIITSNAFNSTLLTEYNKGEFHTIPEPHATADMSTVNKDSTSFGTERDCQSPWPKQPDQISIKLQK